MPAKRKVKNDEGTKEKELKLAIGVKDFGPISSGIIDLKPCTILLGPNNAGKSYFAMLLHTLLEFFKTSINEFVAMSWQSKQRYGIDNESLWKEFPEVKKKINGLKIGDKYEIPVAFIEKIWHRVLDDIFQDLFAQELVRYYACELSDLVRIDGPGFTFEMDFGSSPLILKLKKNNLKIKQYPAFDFKIYVKKTDKSGLSFGLGDNETEIGVTNAVLKKDDLDYRAFSSPFIDHIIQRCENDLRKKTAVQSYYLPASRTGILLLYKALLSDMVKKAPHAGTDKFDIPKFSGVISGLVSFLIELSDKKKGPLFDLTEKFEKELIKGQIIVKSVNEFAIPEIKFLFKNKEIPLHRSSSTVSELAPLFLYLKYSVKPGDLLIIEEPEAHLHPKNIRILTKFVVRLIRSGVKLFITTHSDFLIDQLSTFIQLSIIKNSKKMEELDFDKQDYLKVDETGVYVFRADKKKDGYLIDEVEITEADGISQEEFIKVSESLHEESFRIQSELQEEG